VLLGTLLDRLEAIVLTSMLELPVSSRRGDGNQVELFERTAVQQVFTDRDPFLKKDFDRIEALLPTNQTVATGFTVQLFLVGPKDLIEDDEDSAMVFIQINLVDGMVDPVVAGSIENLLKPAQMGMRFVCSQNWYMRLSEYIRPTSLTGKPRA